MDLGLEGRVALITGGSEGLGRGIATRLAQEGARVAICARREAVLAEAAEMLSDAVGSDAVLAMRADVMQQQDVEALFLAVMERFGRLDILVNNAGTSSARPFDAVELAEWEQDLDLKLLGAIRCIRQAVPLMRAVGGGRIVNILNLGGKTPGASSLPTSVSRAAGMALTKALSRDLAGDNIRVNAVCIGIAKSMQHQRRWERAGRQVTLDQYYDQLARQRGVPLGRVGEAEEAGDLVAFLVSARAAYITGTAINFDGGASAVL